MTDSAKKNSWQKRYPQGKAELSWTLEDYAANDAEVPDRVAEFPERTEGEMMSDDEVEAWFIDSIKTLKILKEAGSAAYPKLYTGFVMDITYLYSIGRVDEKAVEFVKDEDNFDF